MHNRAHILGNGHFRKHPDFFQLLLHHRCNVIALLPVGGTIHIAERQLLAVLLPDIIRSGLPAQLIQEALAFSTSAFTPFSSVLS